MTPHEFASLTLFITGPTHVRREVREAALLPEFGHRDSENEKRMRPVMERLALLAGLAPGQQDYTPVLFNGSGSTALEGSIRSLVSDSDTLLSVSVGAFGDLYHKIAVLNGKRAVSLRFPSGEAVDLDALERALKEHKPQVVALTHNETSTGVVNDIRGCCELVRQYGALALVDGVSIFGGADLGLEQARPAMYVSATQKCLALPAGFGIALVSREAEEKARTVTNRGYSSDLLAQLDKARKFQTLSTPNTALINQLYVQLEHIVEQEGVAARFARHAAMRDQVHAFVGRQPGFSLVAPEGHRSPTLTTVRPSEGVSMADLKRFKERMREFGYLFDPGYGKLNAELEEEGRTPIFRIGHMGDITPAMLEEYLAVLGREMGRMAP